LAERIEGSKGRLQLFAVNGEQPTRPEAETGGTVREEPREVAPVLYARLRAILVQLDGIGAFASWTLVLALSHDGLAPARLASALVTAAAVAVLMVALLAVQKLYRARVCAIRAVEVSRLARTSLACGMLVAWLGPLIGTSATVGASATAAVVSFFVLTGLRGWYTSWLKRCRSEGRFLRPVLIVGTNDEAESLLQLIEAHPEQGYRICGVLGDADGWHAKNTGAMVLGGFTGVADAARSVGASGVLIAMSALSPSELRSVVRELLAAGIHVQVSSGLSRIGHHRLRAAPVSYEPLFYLEPPSLAGWQQLAKRVVDVSLSTLALLVAAPVLGVAALGIRLQDGGDVIYRQWRIGRDGRPFELLKLRSMIPDAASRVGELATLNERSGPLFKVDRDPRVTRIGRLLRATSIDELPQLINVLRGEMSLVGPRPALPDEVAQFDDELQERASVLPGITGLWQVEARDNPSFHAYRRLDLFYVDNWSIAMDLAILLGTARVVLGKGLRSFLRTPRAAAGSSGHAVPADRVPSRADSVVPDRGLTTLGGTS